MSSTVTDENRTVVLDVRGTFSALPNQIDEFLVDVGFLGPGFYRIAVKFRQGKKSVGIRYWIRVDPGTLDRAL